MLTELARRRWAATAWRHQRRGPRHGLVPHDHPSWHPSDAARQRPGRDSRDGSAPAAGRRASASSDAGPSAARRSGDAGGADPPRRCAVARALDLQERPAPAAELQAQGHQVSPQLVSALLHAAGDRVQGARQTRQGTQHPDRNAQFEHLAARGKTSRTGASR